MTTNYANCANPCKPQCSKVKGTYHKVQSSKFKVQSSNLFYISGQEKVRNGVENQRFCYLCKYLVIKYL